MFPIFSKICGDIRKSRCTTGINETGGKFANGVDDTGSKVFYHFPLCCWYRWQICRRCKQRRWQIATIINATRGKIATVVNDIGDKQREQFSNCLQLNINLKKKKLYICLLYNPKLSKQNNYNFSDWRFFHLPPLSTTPTVHFELRISPRIFKKNRNGPNGILRALGETGHEKKQKSKISWHCPFKVIMNYLSSVIYQNITANWS